jgi:RING finger protein 113A
VVTKCEHYFCERCAIQHFQKSRRCFVCSEQTGGIFNKAKAIQEKIDKLKAAEEVASAEDMTQEQLIAEYEASKEAQKRRGHTSGWAIV